MERKNYATNAADSVNLLYVTSYGCIVARTTRLKQRLSTRNDGNSLPIYLSILRSCHSPDRIVLIVPDMGVGISRQVDGSIEGAVI